MGKKNGKAEIRHLKRFMGGRATPQEVFRAVGVRKKCAQCGCPASVRIRVLVELKELIKRQPEFVAQIMASNPTGQPVVPTVPTIHGPMVKVSDVGACSQCRTAAERAAARGPSWAIVEIDAGPKETVQAQVPG